ncbi:6443_t:CDS:2 [Funneliformis mosseae]|uniref:6443_t:CDS:1 n=1 Tax=Funneliformis mosseae TaxID=27381 RepID=A0A9N9DPN7_FUNMO|nr:6443_t:CDS:2 [Funneliformis mosseae]
MRLEIFYYSLKEFRSWTTSGVISPDQRAKFYYADPAETNFELVNGILKGEFVALHGPRASGKSTRVYRTMQHLTERHNCHCFYITLQDVEISDEFDRLYGAIDKVRDEFLVVVGTSGILELNSSNDYDSPFNVRNPLQNPNLSKEQVQKLFEKFELEHKFKNIYGYSTFERIVKDLLKENSRPAVDLLRLQFLPNPEPVTIRNSSDLIQACHLARNGVLITYCPPNEIPKRPDQSIDLLSALRDAVCTFEKQNFRLAAFRSHKKAQVPAIGSTNVLVPRKSVYQRQLADIFTNWISSLGFEVMSQYHITERKTHRYSDFVITAPVVVKVLLKGNVIEDCEERGGRNGFGVYSLTCVTGLWLTSNWPGQPTSILELLATSTRKYLEEHFERTLKYAQSLKQSLNILDVWIVHFTCGDEPNHHWPSKEQRD